MLSPPSVPEEQSPKANVSSSTSALNVNVNNKKTINSSSLDFLTTSPLSSKDSASPFSSSDVTSPISCKDLKSPLSCKDLKSSSKDVFSPESREPPISPLSTTSSLKSPDSTTFLSTNSPEDVTSSSVKINVNPTRTRSAISSHCKICGDKAEGEYYGVMTCESCKGFFKRAIKNTRKYSCINTRDCVLTKKTRNHCKACRLARCYKVGMQKEVVEDEVAREKKEKQEKRKQEKQQKESSFAEVSSSLAGDSQVQTIDLKEINSAELLVDPKISNFANITVDPIRQLCLAADKQLASLAEWAKRLPLFTELAVTNQVKLLQWNWAELLIGGFCYRSSAVSDGILLATGLHLSRDNLQKAGVGTVVNKLFGEVINKMQKLQIDVSEWGCLRAIMLFAPDTKELTDIEKVENIRERYIATLCDYEKRAYPNDPDRLGNLLLRLPPLKAIALQVLEHLFFFKLIGDVPIDTFLLEMLDVDNH